LNKEKWEIKRQGFFLALSHVNTLFLFLPLSQAKQFHTSIISHLALYPKSHIKRTMKKKENEKEYKRHAILIQDHRYK